MGSHNNATIEALVAKVEQLQDSVRAANDASDIGWLLTSGFVVLTMQAGMCCRCCRIRLCWCRQYVHIRLVCDTVCCIPGQLEPGFGMLESGMLILVCDRYHRIVPAFVPHMCMRVGGSTGCVSSKSSANM